MFSKETYKKILAIDEDVVLTPLEMADRMNVTFFPYINDDTSDKIKVFSEKLKKVFDELKVNIVPFNLSLGKIPLSKTLKSCFKICINNFLYGFRSIFRLPQKSIYFSFQSIKYVFKRTKVKKGISIIVLGEQKLSNMPMQYITSFKDNSVISILDFPKKITADTIFEEHFDTAMDLFVHNMSNIILGVTDKKWILYNFNGSHPVYPIDNNLKKYVLGALVPKVVAPIRPYKLEEFILSDKKFATDDKIHAPIMDDLVVGAKKFAGTNLYPKGKKIDDLPFRNEFFKWVGKLHLDHRNGMSFGFMAHQLPGRPGKLVETTKMKEFFINENGNYCVTFPFTHKRYLLEVPAVWVISQKSGSNKTEIGRAHV